MALELAVPLSKADPSNGHYRSALGYLHQRLGSLQAQLGELPAAMANLREALAIHEPELAADPSNATARTRVAMTSEGLGNVHVRLASIETRSAGDRIRDWREARLLFQRAWQVWEDLRKNGSTTGEDAARPAGLAREMAKCDAALARLGAKP